MELTKAEMEVAALVATGLTSLQIAYEMDRAEITVKTHTGKILKKIGSHNRVQITLWYQQHTGVIAPHVSTR